MKKFHVVSLVSLLAAALILVQSLGSIRGWTAAADANSKGGSQTGETLARARVSDQITLRATGRSGQWINLRDGHDLITAYTGTSGLEWALQTNQARPLALATGDFDEDGVPDLISSYACVSCSSEMTSSNTASKDAGRDAGLFTLLRGNVDALYPNTPEAHQRKAAGEFTHAPFLGPGVVIGSAIQPDFLGAGDFDADGHLDVVMAARGSAKLYWLAGDGHGGFGRARSVTLPGTVSSLLTGEINRADGLADIVVGVARTAGSDGVDKTPNNSAGSASVLVFEGAEGALMREPEELPLPANAAGLALGQLDDGYEMDLAVAAGNELVVVHGRDRKLSLDEESRAEVAQARIEYESMPFAISSIVPGDFAGDYRTELALLSAEGMVHVLERAEKNQEWGRIDSVVPIGKSEDGVRLDNGSTGTSAMTGAPQSILVRGRVSVSGKDDLLVLNRADQQLHVIADEALALGMASERSSVSGKSSLRLAESFRVAGEPVAVIPMRLGKHALNDLVVLKTGGEAPLLVAQIAASSIITVNTANTGNTRDNVLTLSEASGVANGTLAKSALTAAEQAQVTGTPTNPGLDEIRFSGVTSITGGNFAFTDAVTIDGSTAGFVEINGNNVANTDGIRILAANSAMRGMVFNRYTLGAGIALGKLSTGGNCIVEGNRIGTDVAGDTVQMSSTTSVSGLRVDDSPNSTIGGTTAAARNIISGTGQGIGGGANSAGLKIQGNYIGVNSAGTVALGNRFGGIILASGAATTGNLTIGGTDPGARNIVSANDAANLGGDGIRIAGNAILVQGNLIGTNASGLSALGDQRRGVDLNSTNSTIGGSTVSARNIISGATRGGIGVVLTGNFDNNPDNNLIQGNYIGTNLNGTAAVGNAGSGILLSTESNTDTIGGVIAGARNIISGNAGQGVAISGGASFPASNHQVLNNYIGTDVNGTANLGNTFGGVTLSGGSNNRIGNTSGGGNIIAFNGSGLGGVSVSIGTNDPFTGNQVRRNSIFGNAGRGIRYNSVNTLDKEPVLSMNGSVGQGRLLAARPNANYVVEFYSNPQCGDAQLVQAQTYIGEITTTTDAGGNSPFFNVPAGLNVTAAATPDTGNTSPLSNCITGVAPSPTPTPTPSPARIDLNPTQLTFNAAEAGPNPSSQTVKLTNTGSSVLNWQATATSTGNWLAVTSPSGASGALAPNEFTTLTVSVNTSGLTGSSVPFQGMISVSAADASNNPQAINVTLALTPTPDEIEIDDAKINGTSLTGIHYYFDGEVDFECDVDYRLVHGDPVLGGFISLEATDLAGNLAGRVVARIKEPVEPGTQRRTKRLRLKFQ
ncbi:MAG TPA: FG-GAP-like repeat-containing protein, partial [Pyrinomonadaceae bacterium]|nr:FG-GAP-like repeat-containing protein [Pyrinomonadaceae bacterium]